MAAFVNSIFSYIVSRFFCSWFRVGRDGLTKLVLLFEVGISPPHDGFRRIGGSIFRASLPTMVGRVCSHYELILSVVSVRTSQDPKVHNAKPSSNASTELDSQTAKNAHKFVSV